MDRVSHNRNNTPPPKKRPRFHPPGFESSFHTVNPSKTQLPHRPASIRTDISIDSHETSPAVLKVSDSALDECGLYSTVQSNNVQSHSHRKKKRVSASFSEFTPAFDMPTLPPFQSKNIPPAVLDFSKASHTEDNDDTRTREVVGESATIPRTPMRLLKPPSLLANHRSISKNHSPLAHDSASNKSKFNSMMSHLPFLKGAATVLASPKGTAIEVDRKLVPLTPPSLPPEPLLQNRHEKPKTVSSSSYAQRAEILAKSVRVSRKHLPTNVELTELARGVELSPQKGSRGRLIQGGLAERAERLLLRSSTNFSLWQAGFVKRLEGAQNTKEDIRLRITSVLSFTRNHPRSSTSSVDALPRTAIARCREVLQGGNQSSFPNEGTVVFLFSNHDRVSSVVRFEEGKDVCVWRPWREIELSSDWSAKEEEVMSPLVSDAGKRTALLCSRFVVMVS